MDGYQIGELLGSGKTGTVRKACKDDATYACKVIDIDEECTAEDEIKCHRACSSHPNVVTLEHSEATPDTYYIFQEMYPCDLFRYLTSEDVCARGGLSERECAVVIKDVLSALAHMHKQGVAHRDVKVENILLNPTGRDQNGTEPRLQAALCDFGFATFDAYSNRAIGTLEYAAPEMLCGRGMYSFKTRPTDVWSAGVALYAMLTGELPFETDDPAETREDIIDCPVDVPEHISAPAADLLYHMLEKDPRYRPSAADCLKSAFLAGC